MVDRWWRVEVEIMVCGLWAVGSCMWAGCGRLLEEARSENRRENGEEDVRERILARM